MNLTSIKPKQWRQHVAVLEGMLREAGDPIRQTRICRVDYNKIALEGGRIMVIYCTTTKKIEIWNKVSRYAGGALMIQDLIDVEVIMQRWQESIEAGSAE